MSKSISDALNLTPIVAVEPNRQVALPTESTEDQPYVRQNIIESIEAGQAAIGQLSVLACNSQDPEMYEVLTKLIEVMVKANKELLTLNGHKKETVTNQNLFVGSTAELHEMLSAKK